jgi:hypothetical protein
VNGFIRGCGRSLLLGGALTILINVIATPLLHRNQASTILASTDIFLVRQAASGVAALLLIFGCLGLHLAQRTTSGAFGVAAFVTSFVGSCLLFAVEWTNVFVLRAVARSNPDVFRALDKNPLLSAGFISAAGLFALGWLLLCISLWRTQILPRRGAIVTLAGLLAIPVLQATPLGLGGAVAGTVLLGLGLMVLGQALATGSFSGPRADVPPKSG